ncbi:MAG: hypothetical protein IJB96_11065 [Lachnospira sp.]|nr:hypothetical protein [Lachnospira sp.]
MSVNEKNEQRQQQLAERKYWSCGIKIHNEMFNAVGMSIGQLHLSINQDNDIKLNGSLVLVSRAEADKVYNIKVNLCNADGEILYILRGYDNITFSFMRYRTFTVGCLDVSRFINLYELDHVEIYPHIVEKSSEEAKITTELRDYFMDGMK